MRMSWLYGVCSLLVLCGQIAVASAGCNPPVIGWWPEEGIGPEPFPRIDAYGIRVQYHDQCSGEESTRVYVRQGTSGAWTEIKYEGYNQGGWRTAYYGNAPPGRQYCFQVAVVGADLVRRESVVRCAWTPGPRGPSFTIMPVKEDHYFLDERIQLDLTQEREVFAATLDNIGGVEAEFCAHIHAIPPTSRDDTLMSFRATLETQILYPPSTIFTADRYGHTQCWTFWGEADAIPIFRLKLSSVLTSNQGHTVIKDAHLRLRYSAP